jgi:hypothetical protein
VRIVKELREGDRGSADYGGLSSTGEILRLAALAQDSHPRRMLTADPAGFNTPTGAERRRGRNVLGSYRRNEVGGAEHGALRVCGEDRLKIGRDWKSSKRCGRVDARRWCHGH